MFHDGKAGGAEQSLHDVFVHAGGGAQHSGADVGNVGEFEQALDGAVFAKCAVQDGKDDVDVDGAIGSAAQGVRQFEMAPATSGARARGDDDGFAAGEDGRARSGFGIARAQVLGFVGRLALQQTLRQRRPSASDLLS